MQEEIAKLGYQKSTKKDLYIFFEAARYSETLRILQTIVAKQAAMLVYYQDKLEKLVNEIALAKEVGDNYDKLLQEKEAIPYIVELINQYEEITTQLSGAIKEKQILTVKTTNAIRNLRMASNEFDSRAALKSESKREILPEEKIQSEAETEEYMPIARPPSLRTSG